MNTAKRNQTVRRAGIGLVVLSLLAIGAVTLGTSALSAESNPVTWCATCSADWLSDVLANVLLFMPLGVGLALAGSSRVKAFAVIAIATGSIELLQLLVVSGRQPSLIDLLTNLSGGTVGFFSVHQRTVWQPRTAAGALRRAGTWATCWVVGTLLTAWAHAPSLSDSLWWAHWDTNEVSAGSAKRGEAVVMAASIGGAPLAAGPVSPWSAFRSGLLRGDALMARAILPNAVTRHDHSFIVVDDADSESELLVLQATERKVAFMIRTRGNSLRMRSPVISVDRPTWASDLDTVEVRAMLKEGQLRLEVANSTGRRQSAIDLSPNMGWSFLLPPRFALGFEVIWYNALWVFALTMPIGFFVSAAFALPAAGAHVANDGGHYRWVAMAILVLPGITMAVVPVQFDVPVVGVLEWAAWLLSIPTGWRLWHSLGA